MEYLIMLVLLVGGSLFAYRQWNALQAASKPYRVETYPVKATVIEPGESPTVTAWIEPEPVLQAADRPATGKTKLKINKWVLFSLALLYLICPLDGDFIPVLGWLDDAIVMAMGIKALMDKSR